MSYKDQLKPWCIVHRLPKLQNAIILRCRRRSLDEGRVLPLMLSVDTKIKRLNPPLQLTCHGMSLPIAIANSSY